MNNLPKTQVGRMFKIYRHFRAIADMLARARSKGYTGILVDKDADALYYQKEIAPKLYVIERFFLSQ